MPAGELVRDDGKGVKGDVRRKDLSGRISRIGGGTVGPQTLDKAVWLIPFSQGADLVWTTLSDADRQAIADSILQVSAREVILPHEMKVHNIQC